MSDRQQASWALAQDLTHTYVDNVGRHTALPSVQIRFSGEAYTVMGAVVPVLAVVIFWAIVFVFAFGAYRRWLRVPTESEIEAEHEADAHAVEDTAVDKVEQPAAH